MRQFDFCAMEMDLQVAMMLVDGGVDGRVLIVWLEDE